MLFASDEFVKCNIIDPVVESWAIDKVGAGGNNNNGLNKNIGYTNTLFFTASISNYNITTL